MQVKTFAECSKGSFRPSLSYHFPLRPLYCIFLSGRLRQVLLYNKRIRGSAGNIPQVDCFLTHLWYMNFTFYHAAADILCNLSRVNMRQRGTAFFQFYSLPFFISKICIRIQVYLLIKCKTNYVLSGPFRVLQSMCQGCR